MDDTMKRRYTFKLYLTPQQDMEVSLQCRMVAQAWNAMLELQEQQYRRARDGRGKALLSFYDLTAQITQMRQQCPEWAELSVWTAHRVADALSLAFQAFFRRAKSGAGAASGYPRYRSTWRADWLPHRFASGCRLYSPEDSGKSWQLYLKGVDGMIHARGKFPDDPVKLTHADIRRDSVGVWWLSVATEMPARMDHGTKPTSVRLDGIDCFALVNGAKVFAHQLGLESDSRIERLAQSMAELERGSPEYMRLRRDKARLQAKAKRRRSEWLHAWTTNIVRQSSEIELTRSAAVKSATQSGHGDEREWGAATKSKADFNQTLLAQAPATTSAMIRYKCEEAGISLHEVDSAHLESGNMVVKTAKAARQVRRELKRSRQDGEPSYV